jgi:hypothetical protein
VGHGTPAARKTIFALLVAAVAAWAHHSTAPFDMTREATISGVVTKFYWANPHAYIYMDVDATDGVQHWAVEIESPNLLRNQGWTKETIKSGDRVTCKGARARDLSDYRMKCFLVELPDGRKLQAQ